MKKILFVNTDMCAGGIEVSLINLLNSIDYGRYDVSLLLLSDNLDFLNRIPISCQVFCFNREDKAYKWTFLYHYIHYLYTINRNIIQKVLLKVLKYLEDALFKVYIQRKMCVETFDISIAYRTGIAAEIAFEWIKSKKRILFYHHGDIIHQRHEKRIYQKADCIVGVSDGITKKVVKEFPYIKNKCVVIHNLVDVDYVRSQIRQREEYEIPIIITTGRLNHEKGFDLLLYACKQLKKDGHKFKLSIIGGADMTRYDKFLKKIVQQENLESVIEFKGTQNNPYKLMSQADIYVQPSRAESYGITIREAQILGLPIISTKTDGASELIKDGETGILCEISVEGLYKTLKKLIGNKELCSRLSGNCEKIDYNAYNMNALEKFYTIVEE